VRASLVERALTTSLFIFGSEKSSQGDVCISERKDTGDIQLDYRVCGGC